MSVSIIERVTAPAVSPSATRPYEAWVGPHRLYVEGREPVERSLSKPAILFVGGAFDGSWIFRREAEHLAGHGWPVYAMNLRGYYKSRWNNVAALSVEDYLEDIRSVRESLNLDRVILSGFSMGGILMLKHAEQHGADALILYDSDPSREVWQALGRHPHREFVPPVLRFLPSQQIVREMWGGWVGRRKYFEFLELFKQSAVSGQSYRLTEYGGLSVNTWKIQCPALLIGIRRDERVQAEWFRRLNATWLVFEGNSHGSILVGPKSMSITEEVTRWLEAGVGQRRKKIFPVLGYLSADAQVHRTRLFYLSGWTDPEVEVRLPGKRPAVRFKMEKTGNGRVEGESLFEAHVTMHRKGGFFLRQGSDEDRPPGGDHLYRPLAREIFLADGEFFSSWPPEKRKSVAHLDYEIVSNELQHKFNIHVMVPRNYDSNAGPYPVCVLNDGQNQWKNQGAFGGWHTNVITAGLCRRGRCRDVFLVSVESTRLNRNKYYLTPPIGRADLYVNFLTDTLLPHLRRDFNLSTHPADIGIVGASYGANCAVYTGMKRPDVFGLIGSLSYAPLKGRPIRSWMHQLPRLPFRKLYLDCGTKWTPNQKGSRTDNTRTTIELIHIAQSKGMVPNRTLRSLIVPGHCHQEPFWRKRVGHCIEFLFSLI